MTDLAERRCTACMFCRHHDYGYSNWTVEGTNHDCLFGLTGLFEDTESAANKVAEKCDFFRPGMAVYCDVDGEDRHESIRDWIKTHIKEPI